MEWFGLILIKNSVWINPSLGWFGLVRIHLDSWLGLNQIRTDRFFTVFHQTGYKTFFLFDTFARDAIFYERVPFLKILSDFLYQFPYQKFYFWSGSYVIKSFKYTYLSRNLTKILENFLEQCTNILENNQLEILQTQFLRFFFHFKVKKWTCLPRRGIKKAHFCFFFIFPQA